MSYNIKVKIFKNLWKFVFRLDNDKAIENCEINYLSLEIFFNSSPRECLEDIKNEKDYYSKVKNDERIEYLILFIAKNHFLYELLLEESKVIIDQYIQDQKEGFILGWFKDTSYKIYLNNVKSHIERSFIDKNFKDVSIYSLYNLLNIGIKLGEDNIVYNFICWRYSQSRSYNDADQIFSYLIQPNIPYFSKEQIVLLLDATIETNQNYGRKRAKDDHLLIKQICESKFYEIDLTKYSIIFKSL